MSLTDEKYLLLTTFRKNGEGKSLPVWMADIGDGTMGFTTNGDSWKCKRIRNDARVTLQPCDSRGRITAGSAAVTGTARLAAGAEFSSVQTLIRQKYGFMVKVVAALNSARNLLGKGGQSDTAVIITLDA